MLKNLILAPIWACQAVIWDNQIFGGAGFGSTRCQTFSKSAILCNIKENQSCKLDKMIKKTNFGPYLEPPSFFVSSSAYTLFQAIILCNLKEN